ncbi:hypothetical protein BC939DRAFT_466076 [Gamsiella multidivaricata]|uniref:uncharacterized protein n=1 Tax=Gamsiella multidivaricata TaxID=101098 RepID=UPI00221FF50B|nr:uncharacterized protein BC939DRAFT_466076 [Gamsiella multidivaricata]KAG0360048.1 hypothetical protein BGZ54_009717 [Gamsiella multidivaricata]KAI7817414.1 hypothetical protein BC939DRAFT_466076 [Gamsiella multidivaricata]
MAAYEPPKVLISGAGLGGLFLAILLEKAGIPYHIYERAAAIKPLGAALALNANILPVFEQLGLLEDIAKFSYKCSSLDVYKESLKPIGAIDISDYAEKTGYDTYIFHRAELYALLLSRIPEEKISLNKKVVWVLQNNEGVMIRTSDNETYHGDILVGADGAYSGVRQNLYKDLISKNLLPQSDAEGLKMGHICMVGTTNPLDPAEFSGLADEKCHFSTIIGQGTAHTWTTTTLPNNRISFFAVEQLDEKAAKDAAFRNSEWGPEANEKMVKKIYDFPIKHGKGKVLGNLIDATPPELISKVFLEEKIFETWYHGRTVLIGDACHKMQPSAGQGAVNAMEDAVVLANCLYDISGGKQEVTAEMITGVFEEYYSQRFPYAKYHVEYSSNLSKILAGQKLSERMLRAIIYNLPKWIMAKSIMKQAGYRPQITFLPMIVPPKGLSVVPQKPSKRYLAEQEAEKQAVAV